MGGAMGGIAPSDRGGGGWQTRGMPAVFVLQHAYDLDDELEVKLLGVYSSEENARRAVERFKLLAGFRDHPDQFHIDRYELDGDHWAEGFFTER